MHESFIELGQFIRCVDEGQPYFARVDTKDEKQPNWVGITKLTDGTQKSIRTRDVREIHTSKEHLSKLGFDEEKVGNTGFFVRGNIIISSVFISGNPNIISGFRLVNNWKPWSTLEQYVVNGKFDLEKFNMDFKELWEINTLLKLMSDRGMNLSKVEEIFE